MLECVNALGESPASKSTLHFNITIAINVKAACIHGKHLGNNGHH